MKHVQKYAGFKIFNMFTNLQSSKYETYAKMYKVQNMKHMQTVHGSKYETRAKMHRAQDMKHCVKTYRVQDMRRAKIYRVQDMKHVQKFTGFKI